MAGLIANVAGLLYDLNDGDEIRLLDYDLGIAAARRLSQRSPAQLYGDSDLGWRMDPRYLDLYWAIHGTTLANYQAIRERIMTVFQPRDNDAVQLVFDFDGLFRAVNVNLDGELLWRDRVEFVEKVSGVFKASDPRLYDPDMHTVLFSLEAGGVAPTGWPIPWPIPWAVGTDVLNMAVSVAYSGLSRLGAPEYPVIRIFGPIDSPIIRNITTDEIIDLSDNGGLSLADPTEWVEVDLANPPRRDAKTILDQDGNSAEQYLTTASDFATWHIAPAGERLYDGSYCTGTNIISVYGTGVTSETLATMLYFDRYLGI
jgi:hypothetical protein